MGMVDVNCPNCGKKYMESCNTWMYGSPIRTCKGCGKQFVDKRWREVAIEGYEPRSVNPTFYLKGIVAFIIVGAISGGFLFFQHQQGEGYSVRFAIMAGICAIMIPVFVVLALRNKLGIEDKANAKYLQESEERLKDKEYVQTLVELGYDVPEKYL